MWAIAIQKTDIMATKNKMLLGNFVLIVVIHLQSRLSQKHCHVDYLDGYFTEILRVLPSGYLIMLIPFRSAGMRLPFTS